MVPGVGGESALFATGKILKRVLVNRARHKTWIALHEAVVLFFSTHSSLCPLSWVWVPQPRSPSILSIYLSGCSSVYLSVNLHIHGFVYLSSCLSYLFHEFICNDVLRGCRARSRAAAEQTTVISASKQLVVLRSRPPPD